MRLLSFESRRAEEMRSLVARMGGEPTVAPSMREVPLDENPAAFDFADRLLAGNIDAAVFLTGVGAEALLEVLGRRHDPAAIVEALRRCRVVVRGPKPTAVLHKRGVRIDLKAPEPNTWRETAEAIRAALDLDGRTVAVQEYGKPNDAFYEELRRLGATVVPVPVYRWALPEDTGPLRVAIGSAAAGDFDIFAFTSAQQVLNVLAVAERMGVKDGLLAAFRTGVVLSIGPTCSECLRDQSLTPDLEASPPKMGPMVRLALERGRDVLAEKRSAMPANRRGAAS